MREGTKMKNVLLIHGFNGIPKIFEYLNEILESYCADINAKPILIRDIGHMGKKSGLETLPKVIELICKR